MMNKKNNNDVFGPIKGSKYNIVEKLAKLKNHDLLISGFNLIASREDRCVESDRDAELVTTVFNNMPITYLRSRISDGSTVDCNEYYAHISGYETISDCINNQNANDYFEDSSQRLEFIQQVINSDGRYTYEIPLFNQVKKQEQWFRFGCKVNVEEDYVDNIGIDITEQKHVEEKLSSTLNSLSESEDRLRRFYENAEVGFFRSIFSTGEVTECNLKMAEIMGYSSINEYLSSDLLKYVYDTRWNETWEQLRNLVRKMGKVSNFEAVAENLKGEQIYLNVSAVYDEDRDLIEGTVFDVTDKKQAMRALFQSELRYKEVAARNPGFGFQLQVGKTGNYNLVFIGGHLEKYFGITTDQAYNNPLKLVEYFHPEDKYSVLQSVKNLSMKSQSWSTKFRIITPEKEIKVLQGFTSPTIVENGDTLWNTVCMDITDQARLEDERVQLESQLKQSQKMEALGTLAGGIAHDFNNILQGIGFAVESCLIENDLSNKTVDRLEKAKKFLSRGSDLVKQILSFCRRDDQTFKAIIIEEQLAEVVNLMKSSLPTTVTTSISVLTDNSIILGSNVQLQQIIMNLCSNAGYAMRENGGTLELSLTKSVVSSLKAQKHNVEAGEYILLSVKDSGPGVPEEYHHRIFEPFYTTKPIGEGTGMGLAVVAGIIEAHNGFIEFESTSEKGAEFKLFFPKFVQHLQGVASEEHAM